MRHDGESPAATAAAPMPALDEAQRRVVRAIVADAKVDARLFVFGSRATGAARPFSDLDLLLEVGAALTWQQRAALRDGFEASDLPFRVDIVTVDELAASFRERVMRERVPL